jgi:hypothetical protein
LIAVDESEEFLAMSDEAKAATEVAKATREGIAASRDLGGFFAKVLGGGLQHLGALSKIGRQCIATPTR